MLWAAYAARRGIPEAVEVWHGRYSMDSLTGQQWRQMCAQMQPCRAAQDSLMHVSGLQPCKASHSTASSHMQSGRSAVQVLLLPVWGR